MLASLTSVFSDVQTTYWSLGLRFLDRNSNTFKMLMTDSMKTVLGIQDAAYMEDFRPIFEKVFLDRLHKKFENCKSKYRADLAQLGKSRLVLGC